MLKLFNIFILYIWGFQHHFYLCDAILIPPSWANETLNPCAKKSWKLLHWPENKRCYDIFTQGPCRETEEIYYDENNARASCRCSKGSAWHPQSKRCYNYFSKGPCDKREYFAFKQNKKEGNVLRPNGECRKYKQCSPGYLFWPPSEKCFLHLSRGPCVQGSLLFENPQIGSTECGCSSDLMSTNFWKYSRSCHELFTKGPCIDGHIFTYNLTSGSTECVCGPEFITNYHKKTKKCFELDTIGPCRHGQLFTFNSEAKETHCSCLPGYVKWLHTNNCFRVFTRGPCSSGNYLHPLEKYPEIGECINNLCYPGELFDPFTKMCYPIGKRGPCEVGKLWVFERATSIRGLCHCDPQLIGYWKPHEICYELGERGPCSKRKILSYDRDTGLLHCKCDARNGFVSWLNGRCIKMGVQRNKLIPVSDQMEPFSQGNSIFRGRIHRGLTLPPKEQFFQNISLPARTNITCFHESFLNNTSSKIEYSHGNKTSLSNVSLPCVHLKEQSIIVQ